SNLEAGVFVGEAMSSMSTTGVTLVLDVPCVRDGVTAFDRMMELANDFARQLGGVVVDDNRTPFGTESSDLIRAQIRQFQDRMAETGIAAGGPLARRLFAL
ncbi:MAG: ZipA, partial [Thauera sp.]|nr:ZipA [Thauera sp.]